MIKSSWTLFYPGLAAGFLLFAVLSKFYRGPLWIEVNAYVGDIGIVACLYFSLSCFYRTLSPLKKAFIIAAVAILLEWFQSSGIPGSWNLPAPFVWVLGSRFDALDFVFYAIGLIIAVFLDHQIVKE